MTLQDIADLDAVARETLFTITEVKPVTLPMAGWAISLYHEDTGNAYPNFVHPASAENWMKGYSKDCAWCDGAIYQPDFKDCHRCDEGHEGDLLCPDCTDDLHKYGHKPTPEDLQGTIHSN